MNPPEHSGEVLCFTNFLDPLQIELPVRANEAAALAEVVFQVTEGRRLNDDLRMRAAGRVELLGLETIVPYFGSLQADPIHPNCFFLAIDAVRGGSPKPYLFRLAHANAPSSGLFQKSILIGRMRPGGGREVVINTVPFGPDHHEAVRTFAKEVDRMFLPRPTGTAFAVASPDASAFAAYRSLQSESGLNAAVFQGEWHAGVVAAIRAGWREGYGLPSAPIVLTESIDPAGAVLDSIGYTKLVLEVSQLAGSAARLEIISAAYDAAVRANAPQQWTWRRPDLEICWAEPVAAEDVAKLLEDLKENGRAAQSAAPPLPGAGWEPLVDAVRGTGAALRIDSQHPALQEIARACGGRLQCFAAPGEDVRALVKLLRT